MEDEGRMELNQFQTIQKTGKRNGINSLALITLKRLFEVILLLLLEALLLSDIISNMPGTRNFMKRTATPAYGVCPGGIRNQ